MVQLAVSLDSLGKKAEAAAAYEAFAAAYPKRQARAADAQYNAAVTYAEVGDTAAAARAYGDVRVAVPARPARGAGAQQRIWPCCGRPATRPRAPQRELARYAATNAMRAPTSARRARRSRASSEFRAGAAMFPQIPGRASS